MRLDFNATILVCSIGFPLKTVSARGTIATHTTSALTNKYIITQIHLHLYRIRCFRSDYYRGVFLQVLLHVRTILANDVATLSRELTPNLAHVNNVGSRTSPFQLYPTNFSMFSVRSSQLKSCLIM